MSNKIFDISFLNNQTISQLAFGINYISLIFDDGYIQINNGFSLKSKNGGKEFNGIYPVRNDFGLLVLLEKKIIHGRIITFDRTCDLLFEDDYRLLLFKNKMYESYEISHNGERIII